MERLFVHIEQLLIRNDYVIVPGFGGFVVQNLPSIINSEKVTPPLSTIGFNPLLSHSDGLLAIEISRTEGISYREAVSFIEEQVQRITEKIKKGETLQVGKLGSIFILENNIIFSPPPNLDFLPSNFGLTAISALPKKGKTLQPKEKVLSIPVRKTSHYVAAATLILGLLLVPTKVFDSGNQEANFLNFPTQETVLSADSLHFIETGIAANNRNETGNTIEKQTIITPEVYNSVPKKYHIIVGCFQNRDKAENYYNKLISENYETASIIPSSLTYKVSINAFENETEALDFLKKLRGNSEFSSAWLNYLK